MGMVLALRKLSQEDIERFHIHPEIVMSYLFGEEAESFEPDSKINLWNFLKKIVKKQPIVKEKVCIPETLPEDEIDIDKSWHILHYLFTGSANGKTPPGCYLLEGGRVIKDVEIGYGPVYTLDIQQVKEFSAFVFNFDQQTLEQRFNKEEMKKQKIYVAENTSSDFKEELLPYVLENLGCLKNFLVKAVDENKGLMIYMC